MILFLNQFSSRGTEVPPTTPTLLFIRYFGARVSTKKKTIILCYAKYHCRNCCTSRAKTLNFLFPKGKGRGHRGTLIEPTVL